MSKTTETTKRTTIAASHSAQLDKSKDLSTSMLLKIVVHFQLS